MAKTEKFEEDLNSLLSKLGQDVRGEARDKLNGLVERLMQLHRANVVKINHSVMELVCARHLILKGYDATVEHTIDGCLLYTSDAADE
mgnify:CR=1 FL=1